MLRDIKGTVDLLHSATQDVMTMGYPNLRLFALADLLNDKICTVKSLLGENYDNPCCSGAHRFPRRNG